MNCVYKKTPRGTFHFFMTQVKNVNLSCSSSPLICCFQPLHLYFSVYSMFVLVISHPRCPCFSVHFERVQESEEETGEISLVSCSSACISVRTRHVLQPAEPRGIPGAAPERKGVVICTHKHGETTCEGGVHNLTDSHTGCIPHLLSS